MIYYAGIGSRETPDLVRQRIMKIAGQFADMGFTLRSGGVGGADSAFELGCIQHKGPMEIFLPWKNFNGNTSPYYEVPDSAYRVAEKYHPAWINLSPAVKKLLARNTQQICGRNLDSPSDFVVCWTPDGCTSGSTRTYKTGGTGQAIAIASDLGIPVINLFNENAEQQLQNLLKTLSNV